jgi:hypothetical protein
MTILSWQENLTSEETPPEWMWPVTHELEVWFERVEAERDERYGSDDRDQVPLMENELARELKGR